MTVKIRKLKSNKALKFINLSIAVNADFYIFKCKIHFYVENVYTYYILGLSDGLAFSDCHIHHFGNGTDYDILFTLLLPFKCNFYNYPDYPIKYTM